MSTLRTPARILLAGLAGLLAACAPNDLVDPDSGSDAAVSALLVDGPRHILVLAEDVPSDDLRAEIHARGGVIERRFDTFGVLTVRGLDSRDVDALVRMGEVADGGEDITAKWVPSLDEVAAQTIELPSTLDDQSGAFFYALGMQWNMDVVGVPQAWQQTVQGDGTVVAILDTGIDPFHIDMQGKVVSHSASLLTAGSSPCGPDDENTIFDLNFHGTFVAGLVSTNGLGMASVAPNAQIMGVKVLNCSGSGSFADIIAGMAHAVDNGADVINMSLGAYFSRSAPGARAAIRALDRAILYAVSRGAMVVASSGNDGLDLDSDGDFVHVPSQLRYVLSIGATAPVAQQDFDMLASYSNYGWSGVDMVAPGGDLTAQGICGFAPIYRCDLVLSTLSSFLAPGPNYYVLSAGTSFASPMVAGAAAVATAEVEQGAFGEDVEACLLLGSEEIGDFRIFGSGRLSMPGMLACGMYGYPYANGGT